MNKEFIDYVWGFYGSPDGLYQEFFNGQLKFEQVTAATILVEGYFNKNKLYFEGTSIEREITRDFMLKLYDFPKIKTHPFDWLEYDLEYEPLIDKIIDWHNCAEN